MSNRCRNPSNKCYKDYGERGITVCDEWFEFMPFYDWGVNNGWETGLELDRINNNGNYTPSNCRFVTRKKNLQNTKTSKWWFINGLKFESARDASEHFNVSQPTILAWCNGKNSRGYYYPPKKNCYSERKYQPHLLNGTGEK